MLFMDNEEEGRKPVKPFLEEVDKYPGLLQIVLKLEGLDSINVLLMPQESFSMMAIL